MAPIIKGTITSGRKTTITDGDPTIVNTDSDKADKKADADKVKADEGGQDAIIATVVRIIRR